MKSSTLRELSRQSRSKTKLKRTRSQKKEHALKIRKYKRKDDQKDLLEEYKILAARIKANITWSIFVFEAYGGVFSPLRTIVVF